MRQVQALSMSSAVHPVNRLGITVLLFACSLFAQQTINGVGNQSVTGTGGGGSVSSVTLAGTANQITATGTCTITTTGTCTLSLPSGLIIPGTINGLTITTTIGTLTISSAKVLTVSNSITLAGTDGVTITFPTTNAVMARTDAGQTFTGVNTFSSAPVMSGASISATSVPHSAIAATAVTPGSYTSTNLTVAADGSITAASNGSGGGGTVTVVGAGSLISTGCVTGGGTTTIQTPSANCTVDSSGNLSTTSLSTGAGSGVGGTVSVTQGTLPGSFPANSFSVFAPTSIPTAFQWRVPTADSLGFIRSSGAGTPGVLSIVGETGSGNVMRGTGPTALAVTLSDVTGGGSQCIHANNAGLLTGTGSDCGSGGGGSGGGTSGWSGIAASLLATATQYAPFVGGRTTTATGTESTVQLAAPATATITNLKVSLDAAVGGSATITVTLRDASAGTALTCTTASGGTSCSDTTHSVNIMLGDLVDFQIVATGTVTAATPNLIIGYAVGTSGVGVTNVSGTTGSIAVSNPTTTPVLSLVTACASTNTGSNPCLETHTASTSTDLEFSCLSNANYDEFRFEVLNLVPTTSGLNFFLQVGTGGGPTYDTGANYTYVQWRVVFASQAAGGGGGQTAIEFDPTATDHVGTNPGGLSGTEVFYNPASTAFDKSVTGGPWYAASAAGVAEIGFTGGAYNQHTAITAVRFFSGTFGTNTIASGTIRCYGVSH